MAATKKAWLVDEFDNPISEQYPISDLADFDAIEDEALALSKQTRNIIGIRISGFGVYRYHSANGLSTSMFVFDWYAPRFLDDLVQEQEIHSFRLKEVYH